MNKIRKILPWISALMCVVLLVLLLMDALWPSLYVFNSALVKCYVLVTAIVAALTAILLISRNRAAIRRRRRR